MITSELAIDLKNVTKIYRGKIHALQGIEMHVRRGEIFGLLGPNGAGKSTLVKIMMSIVRPTRAEGTVLGKPVGNKATLGRVGYLPENHRFPRYLTGRQTLEFFGAMCNVNHATCRSRAEELLATVKMTDSADRKVSTYSKGMMQRVGLAQALMNDPDLILLDEPTDGVDPVGRRAILDVLGSLRQQGKTVFINSHALSELETICDRVAILNKGKVARQGRVDELTIDGRTDAVIAAEARDGRGDSSAVAQQRYEIEVAFDDPPTFRARVLGAIQANWRPLAAPPTTGVLPYASAPANWKPPGTSPIPENIDRGMLPSGAWIELAGPTLRIGLSEPALLQPIIDGLRSKNLVIRRVQLVKASLEDLFFATVADAATPTGAGPARNGGTR